MTAQPIPFPRPQPKDDGTVKSAAALLAWHYDNPPDRPDILGDMIRNVWGRPRT